MRLPEGGRIDRAKPLRFTVDDVEYLGYAGDTLASAMIANGLLEVAPSTYRGRPRGIFAAGVDEPNALVQLDDPMLLATTVELVDGLAATTLRGRGRLTDTPDNTRYDKRNAHCDVLVIGGGPAGLAAALAAGRTGARTILVDEQRELGGSLLTENRLMGWLADTARELGALPETRVLTGTTAFGYYDQNFVALASKTRLWHVRAKRVVLATGAHERPLVFVDNDLPGIMLASAVRQYANRYAVLPGRDIVVATTNDGAYGTAFDLAGQVSTIVDSRAEPPAALAARARHLGIEVIAGSVVRQALGQRRIEGVLVGDREIACDLLAVSGGWNPAVHLFSQSQGRTRYDERVAAFVPDTSVQAQHIVGAANAVYDLAGCLEGGAEAGLEAATLTGFAGDRPGIPHTARESGKDPQPVWFVDGPEDRQFVDLQRDATVADVRRATGAGMRSVEHVKRYTTIGTAHDQGKTSGFAAIGVIARLLGAETPQGTTTYRPPYTPVSFALLAGRDRGELHDPVRTTPMHDWHVRNGARFENVGQWKRPWYYPQPGEDMKTAVLRECRAARTSVAVMDASTLGKIDIQGQDAGEFLNRMYTNAFAKLKVGHCRYGLLCKADGMVFDDGVVMRIAEDRFLATTTTGNAATVLDWFEEWSQTEWPELKVWFTSVTEQWATIAVVGPQARTVLAMVAPDVDCSAAAFDFMTFKDVKLADGTPARIARVSFSGELAFEINVDGRHGARVWDAVMATGLPTPYGTETMHVLRAEKGYVIVGQDTDGTVTPQDLGMEWIVSPRKDFVGKRSYRRVDTARPDRKHLVGLLPADPDDLLPEGAQLIAPDTPLTPPVPMLGHVTSSYHSAALERTFALALLKGGRQLIGQTVLAPLGDRTIAATVTEPIFYDPEGTRRDG
ncbi:2Fe-2S iron-sulfur cluster-binding protein [Kutzneria sp. NPDC052558]|uniref:2Fe-2S iron-sulfur cluster-binding protein n=1 Tax=Kutzneria sp. NPDC052558 TaxID=3364121 RepID=UPI0037C765F4